MDEVYFSIRHSVAINTIYQDHWAQYRHYFTHQVSFNIQAVLPR